TGGFRADVLTNSVQFVLMFLGFGALLFFSMQQFGPAGLMLDQLPEQHLEFFGGESWQYVLSWYIISLQTFVDPSFHQRCAAAKSASTARRGIIISILFWMVFDSLTLLTGLYAKAYIDVSSPLMAYPALGEAVLPVAWKGLFVTALLAAVMSTLDSYAFISAATIGHDILRPLRKNARPESLTRIGLVITSIFGVALAIILPSAVDIIYKTASIAVPGLLIPLTFSFSRRWHLGARHAGIIMYSASGASAIWTLGQIYSENIAGGIALFDMFEPMLPGIAISMVLGAIWIRKR
ncbi:MAG: sodium:solute symporter family protein, partial [Bacteroidota bacterium]